ncbi:hypothetical protein [Merismopedia glauca]|uniref:Uncharacterized protein n=1 Tax=Merismopedia glauca CCAP 1448/3 TaxID=1296344 RepID=A0A2T1C939_9CYAN|nr:hypothetical protein [Merismopedia glauca]PSB04761.1 hypothetical protein C7B64_02780 [Merismopedia glauca CCAP 1448/3]
MKPSFTNCHHGSSLNYKWLFVSAFLLTNYFHIVQIDPKAAIAEDTRVANVDHDIDDIINTSKRKYRPSNYQRNSQIEADLPRNTNRPTPQQNNSNSEQNRQQNRNRKKN